MVEMEVKCPICEKLFGREEKLVFEVQRPSLLGLGVWLEFFCENCGMHGEVKVGWDVAEELVDEEEKDFVRKLAEKEAKTTIKDLLKELKESFEEVVEK